MKANKIFSMLAITGMFFVNAMRSIEGKILAWKNKNKITMSTDYSGGGRGSEGSKRGKGMSQYHRRRANMHGRDHNAFGTFSPIKHVYGLKLSWELK
jgi:hypothetical protein